MVGGDLPFHEKQRTFHSSFFVSGRTHRAELVVVVGLTFIWVDRGHSTAEATLYVHLVLANWSSNTPWVVATGHVRQRIGQI